MSARDRMAPPSSCRERECEARNVHRSFAGELASGPTGGGTSPGLQHAGELQQALPLRGQPGRAHQLRHLAEQRPVFIGRGFTQFRSDFCDTIALRDMLLKKPMLPEYARPLIGWASQLGTGSAKQSRPSSSRRANADAEPCLSSHGDRELRRAPLGERSCGSWLPDARIRRER